MYYVKIHTRVFCASELHFRVEREFKIEYITVGLYWHEVPNDGKNKTC